MRKYGIIAFSLAASLAAASLLGACATTAPVVPEGLTAREIIQKAQEATDKYDWSGAESYYLIALQRYSSDLQTVCACEYEIAFIHYKLGEYAVAKDGFTKLLGRYQGADAQLLPQQYKVLSEAILKKVTEALASK
jgi:outer membrane protein assembly factor BamD (BamD/ComL family)